MEVASITSNSIHKCAFCKHWYDPTNSAIAPRNKPFWEYDPKAVKRCLINNREQYGYHSCSKYECKLPR